MLTRWKYKPENSWNGNRNGCPDYPEVQARAKAHLRETESQLNRLEQCLSSMGESSSTLKDTTQSVMGNIMALGHSMAGDEILKNTFANNAFEHFEIAAYKSLLTLCGPAGADSAPPLLGAHPVGGGSERRRE